MVEEVREWLGALDQPTYEAVMVALVVLSREGPSLGRPLVDTISGSRLRNLKELRPPAPGRQAVRVLFAFDPIRQAFLLVAGDKAGQWRDWYRTAVPVAERRYERHLKELDR
jgi:hypothetical protein